MIKQPRDGANQTRMVFAHLVDGSIDRVSLNRSGFHNRWKFAFVQPACDVVAFEKNRHAIVHIFAVMVCGLRQHNAGFEVFLLAGP